MLGRIFPLFQDDTPLRAARHVIDALDSMQPVAALDALRNCLLDGLGALPSSSGARRLLATTEAASRSMARRGLTEMAQSKDSPVRFELLQKRVALLADQLCNTYYIEFRREVAAIDKDRGGSHEILQALAESYLYWCSIDWLLHQISGTASDQPGLDRWLTVYRRASGDALNPLQPIHARDNDYSRRFAHLLLISSTIQTSDNPFVALLAARCCETLADAVWFGSAFHLNCPLLIEADKSPPIRRLIGWEQVELDGKQCFFGLADVCVQCADYIEELELSGLVPNELKREPDQTVPDTMRVLAALRKVWTEQPGFCRNPKLADGANVTIAFDLLRIRSLITQKNKRLLANDPLIWTCPVDDYATGGFGLELAEHARFAGIDGAVALWRPASEQWWVGVIRRRYRQASGKQFLGIQLLSNNPDPIRLQGSQVNARWQAIYLPPGPLNDHQPAMMIDTPDLVSTQQFETEIEGKAVTLVVVSRLSVGPDQALYRVKIVPPGAAGSRKKALRS